MTMTERRASRTADAAPLEVPVSADGGQPADAARPLDLTKPADLAKLRADIQSTRAELGATIDALVEKLNLPRRAMNKAAELVASVRGVPARTVTRVKAAWARSIARRGTRGSGDGGTA